MSENLCLKIKKIFRLYRRISSRPNLRLCYIELALARICMIVNIWKRLQHINSRWRTKYNVFVSWNSSSFTLALCSEYFKAFQFMDNLLERRHNLWRSHLSMPSLLPGKNRIPPLLVKYTCKISSIQSQASWSGTARSWRIIMPTRRK